ncbi:hypothetical protein Ancab_039979 [Ancistrocladus abbreviatus]
MHRLRRYESIIPNSCCHCGAQVSIWISLTYSNPGRRFVRCAHYPHARCSLFEWLDEETSPRARNLIPIMRDAVRYYKSMAERVQMQKGGTSGRSLHVGEEHEIRRLEIQLAICDNEKMKCMEELRQWKIMAERR